MVVVMAWGHPGPDVPAAKQGLMPEKCRDCRRSPELGTKPSQKTLTQIIAGSSGSAHDGRPTCGGSGGFTDTECTHTQAAAHFLRAAGCGRLCVSPRLGPGRLASQPVYRYPPADGRFERGS